MGNITSTPKDMGNNDLQFGVMRETVIPGSEDLFERIHVQSEFTVSLSTGDEVGDSAGHMLSSHPAYTESERLTLAALLKKGFNYDVSHSRWQGE